MTEAQWRELKDEYVTGETSIRKLAAKTGIDRGTIEHRCKKEEWVKLRDAYRQRVSEKTLARIEAEAVKAAAERLMAIYNTADSITAAIRQKIQERDVRENASAQDLNAFASAINKLHAMEIAGERLKLDKTRADAEQKAEVTVTFTGDTEKWAR